MEFFENLTKAQQIETIRKMTRKAQSRISRLKRAEKHGGIDTSALQFAKKMGVDKFNKKTLDQSLKNRQKQYYALEKWLNFKTSTVSGAKQTAYQQQRAVMGQTVDEYMRKLKREHPRYKQKRLDTERKKFLKQVGKKWELYNKWLEQSDAQIQALGSNQQLKIFRAYIQSNTGIPLTNQQHIDQLNALADGLSVTNNIIPTHNPQGYDNNVVKIMQMDDISVYDRSNILHDYRRAVAHNDFDALQRIQSEYNINFDFKNKKSKK